MHQIANELKEQESFFTPYGENDRKETVNSLLYISKNNLKIDWQGRLHSYDLVLKAPDLLLQKDVRYQKIVLVQEPIDDEKSVSRFLRRTLFTPRSAYDQFCVASGGYRDLFISRGADPGKIMLTGLPNYDNYHQFLNNRSPHKNFVLVGTPNSSEILKPANRQKLIQKAIELARGRKVIVKLHSDENFYRSQQEIQKYAPDALVFLGGRTEEMIANCGILITTSLSEVYVGLAFGKAVYSNLNAAALQPRIPLQNGQAARNIANICRDMLGQRNPEKTIGRIPQYVA
jgi:hypothetical protein